MKLKSTSFRHRTVGRSAIDLSAEVHRAVSSAGIREGLCTVFVHHTSASLMLCENADPDVLRDLETWFSGAIIDGDARFRHRAEGDDDMSAHIRSVLTGSTLQIPVANGRPDLGTWQGVFLLEHRAAPHNRRLTVTVIGE